MYGNVERQARRFSYPWFRHRHREARKEESHDLAAGRCHEFIARVDVTEGVPEDEPSKLVLDQDCLDTWDGLPRPSGEAWTA